MNMPPCARQLLTLTIFAWLLAACGSEPTAATPPQPTETPSAAPPPISESPPPTTTASSSASAAPESPPKPQSSGRPSVLKSAASEITDTFGSTPGAKLELGDKEIATLRLPEGGLRTATVITFKVDGRGKSTSGQMGKIYHVNAVVPPSSTPEPIESNGPPFVIELPAGSKNANLAVGVEDDKGKVTWTIVAAKRTDDVRHVAVFELSTLPSGWLHVTTKAPTGAK